VSTGVVCKQGGVEMSAHCRTGLHELATKSTDFAVIKVQRTPSNLRGDRRACRTDLAADCLSRNETLIKPAKQFFVYKSRACVLHPHHSVSEYHVNTTERMEYTTIQKGRGYVYAHRNQLYERLRTHTPHTHTTEQPDTLAVVCFS